MLRVWKPFASPRGWPQVFAALLWAGAAATAVLWLLHLPRPQTAPPAEVASPAAPTPSAEAVARALGHATVLAATPALEQRFELRGVIASASGQGSALIVVDGQPPRAFVQGQAVVDGWHLQGVDRQSVRLAAGAGTATNTAMNTGTGKAVGSASGQPSLELRLPSKP